MSNNFLFITAWETFRTPLDGSWNFAPGLASWNSGRRYLQFWYRCIRDHHNEKGVRGSRKRSQRRRQRQSILVFRPYLQLGQLAVPPPPASDTRHTTVPSARSVRSSRYLAISCATCETVLWDRQWTVSRSLAWQLCQLVTLHLSRQRAPLRFSPVS